MNILHIGNTAGVASIIAKGQRELGHNAQVLETWKEYRGYPHDMENYYIIGKTGIKDWIKTPLIALKQLKTFQIAKDFDIMHVHSGMRWTALDAPLIKIFQHKLLVVHYHGSDLREGYGTHYQRFIDKKIVATPDLLEYAPDAVFVPNPVELLDYSFERNMECPVIVHMPSVRKKKGTELILNVINELKNEGHIFKFRLIENAPHREAMREMMKAHIVIDKVIESSVQNYGQTMGVVSFEAMSAGKVAVCSITDNMLAYYPGCPVINAKANGSDLKNMILYCIEHPDEMKKTGKESREYIEKNHLPSTIAKQVQIVYEDALKR